MAQTSPASPPDPALLGEVRRLTDGFKVGDSESFRCFRDLAALLLCRTVLSEGQAPRLTRLSDQPNNQVLGGMAGPQSPLRLRNGHFLKLVTQLTLDETPQHGRRLKVVTSSYQYQLDAEADDWVFRYDYFREPPAMHPAAHLHVRSDLRAEADLSKARHLHERVHYPTGRVSLEAVIRLLIEQYGVEPVSPEPIWRSLLFQAESAFREIAHQPDIPRTA